MIRLSDIRPIKRLVAHLIEVFSSYDTNLTQEFCSCVGIGQNDGRGE